MRDASEDTLAQIVHGPGIDNPLALIALDSQGTETGRLYYHTDHLGSVRLLTDDSSPAVVVQTYDYTAYGVRLDDPAADTTLNPFHYTGREYHAASGLYFYRARFYDPDVGSFISADPIGLLTGVNVYLYVGAVPTRFTDPTGLQWYPGDPQPHPVAVRRDPPGGPQTPIPLGWLMPIAPLPANTFEQIRGTMPDLSELPGLDLPPGVVIIDVGEFWWGKAVRRGPRPASLFPGPPEKGDECQDRPEFTGLQRLVGSLLRDVLRDLE